MAVGIFDSGLGGLTVYQAAAEALPDVPFVYFGDNANTPYGVRDAEDIYKLTTAGVTRLFEAGCDDALLSFSAGVATLDFDRARGSFQEAVVSAIGDVERAGLDVTVTRVAPDDLVNAADIARRASVSREAARNWIAGKRGGGGFPPPCAQVGSSPVWSWLEVAGWLQGRGLVGEEVVAVAETTAALNRLLEEKRMRGLEAEMKRLRSAIGGGSSGRRARGR